MYSGNCSVCKTKLSGYGYIVELLSTFVHFVVKHETCNIVCMHPKCHFKIRSHLRFNLFDL